MNRIAEIKERWKDFKADDVPYLLSRLEIAEKALENAVNGNESVEQTCREALQQIRS